VPPALVVFEEDLCEGKNGSMKLEQSLSEGTVLAMGKYVSQLRFVIGGWEWSICFSESFFRRCFKYEVNSKTTRLDVEDHPSPLVTSFC
jgi:hypothetical protein